MPSFPRLFLTCAGLVLILRTQAPAQEVDVRVTVQKLIDGTVRGATFQAGLDEQQAKVQAAWTKVFLGKAPTPVQTQHLFLLGTVPGKTLKDVGANLEKHYGMAVKALALDEEPWPGKLAVFFLNE